MEIELVIDERGDVSVHHNAGENVRVTVLPPDGFGFVVVVGSGVHTHVARIPARLGSGPRPVGAQPLSR